MYRNELYTHFFFSILPNLYQQGCIFLLITSTVHVWKCGREDVGVKFIFIHFIYIFIAIFCIQIQHGAHIL
jgi:hypothetical protein